MSNQQTQPKGEIQKVNPSMFGAMSQIVTEQATPGGMEKIVDTSGGGSFVSFATPKKLPDLLAAMPGIQDGSPYHCRAGKMTLLNPMKFHLVDAAQYWVHRDDQDKALSVLVKDPRNWKDQHKENVEAVILVYVGDELVPATCSFRTVKCPAAIAAINANKEAKKPAWGDLSQDHKMTLSIPDPYARVVTTVTTYPDTARTTGRKMVKARGTPRPISAGEIKLLVEANNNSLFIDAFNRVFATYKTRVTLLQKLASENPANK